MSDATINLADMNKRLDNIAEQLGEFKDQAPKVLKNAINDTARKSKKLLANEAKSKYTVKNAGFSKSLQMQNATVKTLTAKIESRGKPLQLSRFKVSPASPKTTSKATKTKVYSDSSMKLLEKDGIKAFITRFASGHIAVAQREGKARYPIRVLYSMSVPKMLGNEKKVMKKLRPEILKILDEQTDVQIKKLLKRMKQKSED